MLEDCYEFPSKLIAGLDLHSGAGLFPARGRQQGQAGGMANVSRADLCQPGGLCRSSFRGTPGPDQADRGTGAKARRKTPADLTSLSPHVSIVSLWAIG